MLVGIDPGQTGALAFLHMDGTIVSIEDMPVSGGKVCPAGISALIEQMPVSRACIEMVGSMPGQGVASTFKFGEGYGALQGVLAAHGIPVVFVSPAKWKRDMGISKDKDVSRRRALEIAPQLAARLARKKDDGRAEAFLIGLWALRGVLRDAA